MVESHTKPFDAKASFNILKIICLAMIFGVLLLGLVLTVVQGPPQSTTFDIMTSGIGVFVTFVNISVALLVFRRPIQTWKKPVETEKQAEGSRFQYKPTPPDPRFIPRSEEELAFGEWQTTALIRFALLEGSALVNIIFAFFMDQHGNVIHLACAGFSIALMTGVFFPTWIAWEEYRTDRVAQLVSEGWQPPEPIAPST